MATRMSIWVLAGVIVAAGWGLYFSIPGNGPHFNNWALVYCTIPPALLGRRIHMPLTVYQTAAINAAFYAVVGLAFETAARLRSLSRTRLHSR